MEINKINKNKNLERKGKTEKGAIRKIKNKKLEGLGFGKNEGRRQGGALHGKYGEGFGGVWGWGREIREGVLSLL